MDRPFKSFNVDGIEIVVSQNYHIMVIISTQYDTSIFLNLKLVLRIFKFRPFRYHISLFIANESLNRHLLSTI